MPVYCWAYAAYVGLRGERRRPAPSGIDARDLITRWCRCCEPATRWGGPTSLDWRRKRLPQHPDAEIILSCPGLGLQLGARVLAEVGDDRARFADARRPDGIRRLLAHSTPPRPGWLARRRPAQPLSSAERAVCPDREGGAPVVLEAHPPVELRLGMGAGSPVAPQLAAQRDPEPAPAALFVIPSVPIIGRCGRPVPQPQPSLVDLVVVTMVITRPRPARHQPIPRSLEQIDRLHTN